MNLKLLQTGFDVNKSEYFEILVKKYFCRLGSMLPCKKVTQIRGLVSEEGLGIVLTKLHLFQSKKTQGIKLLDILGDPNFLFFAWYRLKEESKKAFDMDKVFLQDIGVKTLDKLSSDLLNKKYKPVLANKKLSTEKRFLGIPTSRDKIVQQAIKIILEPVFEPHFSQYSHGFRPNRSCHTALRQMDEKWNAVAYFIHFDLEKCFDKLASKQIIMAIKKHCSDRDILAIIYKQIKSGCINFTSMDNISLAEGVPQKLILSPLLSNILLHEFDSFIEKELLPKYNKHEVEEYTKSSNYSTGEAHRFNKENSQLGYKIKAGMGLITTRVVAKMMRHLAVGCFLKDDSIKRLSYVRFINQLVFGYAGSKTEALEFTSEIVWKLEQLGVYVNELKTQIAHYSKGIRFLSYDISGRYPSKSKESTHKGKQGVKLSGLVFSAPIKLLLERAKERGFVMSNKRGKINTKLVARKYDGWLYLEPHRIVKRYNAVIRGIINYYQGCTHRSELYEVLQIYRRSCALTLAHHFHKRSYTWAINKYGKDLSIEYQDKRGKKLKTACVIPILFGNGRFKLRNTYYAFPQVIESALNSSRNFVPQTTYAIKAVSKLMCQIPNCPNKADRWHHVKHRRKSKVDTDTKHTYATFFIKQIPICEKHQQLIHLGRYNGPSLKTLKGYRVNESFV